MGMRLHLNIVCPEREVFDGEVDSVTLPATMGRFTILPHHAPIVSSLTQGKLTCQDGASGQEWNIQGGVVEMSDNKVSVCVELE